jgi:hypothetical protein
MTQSIVSTVTETHPLRAAVEAAEAELALAQQALDIIAEPADDCPEGHRVSAAEDRLVAAKMLLSGSGCPRQWELREGGYEYDEVTAGERRRGARHRSRQRRPLELLRQ